MCRIALLVISKYDDNCQKNACRGLPIAQVAVAWILSKPPVTAPIIGTTKSHHLDDAVAALSVQLVQFSPLLKTQTSQEFLNVIGILTGFV